MASSDPTTSERSERLATAEFFDADDLEALTGTPASTWRNWARKGYGPARFKIGRRWVWRKATVLAWLEEQEAASA